MKGIVLCNKGIEDIAALDVREIIKGNSEKYDGYVCFDLDKKEELCKLAYVSQSIKKVLLVLDSFKFKSKEEIVKKSGKLKMKEWLTKKRSFKVDALIEECTINAEEVKGDVGEAIIKKHKQKVDLENPDVVIFLFVHKDECFFCVDFSGKDLSKREYRIFSSPKNIKATLAYAMVRYSGFKRGEALVDPFCLSGGVAIEAALFENNFPKEYFSKDELVFKKFMKFDFESLDKKKNKDRGKIYAFDSQFRNVDCAKKNAKIAGINKAINFSRLEIEWLDTKFDKESVDRIVTCLPNITKYSDRKAILKKYMEFFYQAEFVLSKKGRIVICTKNADEVKEKALEKGFGAEDEKEVWQGMERLWIVRFSR